MKGKLVVIEGIDGSGKGTQSKLLVDQLKREGYSVQYINFPQYESWSSIFIKKYLDNGLGDLEEIGPKQASIFYALDRYVASKQIKDWLKEGCIVISNRYISSNKGHQMSKIEDKKEREEFLEWLNNLEYNILRNPKENVNIFLDVDPKVAQELIDQKSLRDYLSIGKKRDIHEDDIDHLKKARDTYLWLIEKEKNWYKIDCMKNSEILSIEEIHNKLCKLIKEKIL
ncbi:MAG: dTMP kinase [Candidatus Woesearchaeota archaeon]|nr:MAG: dTMP kinase [Candidatus Woesearchaeota archaeon]